MDLVRKISVCLGIIFLSLSILSCRRHSGVEPEWEYRIFSFRNYDYRNYVLCEEFEGNYALFSYFQGVDGCVDYVELHKLHFISNNSWVPKSCVLSNIRWNDYDFESHSFYFSDEEILDNHPFESYYLVPEHVVGIPFFSYPIDSLAIEAINTLIDNGIIEQYRVDLGY